MSPEKRVLVVEDDGAIRAFLATLLSHSGYACDFSPDGNDAVARLRKADYDAILLDLILPGQYGFDILRFLNAERPLMAPRVIVMTAASQATLRDFDASKVHAVMRKPFDIDQLLTNVRACTSMD